MLGVRRLLLSFRRKRLVICIPLKTAMNYFILTVGDIAFKKLCHWSLSAPKSKTEQSDLEVSYLTQILVVKLKLN